jgi:hypothetical protein
MTAETPFSNDEPLRFKIIRPVYETLTVNDNAAKHFEPREAITSSSHVVRLFDFLGRETRKHF